MKTILSAEGAELWCIISNYTKAKLPKYNELCTTRIANGILCMAEARGFAPKVRIRISTHHMIIQKSVQIKNAQFGGQVCHKLEPSQGGTYSLGQTLNSYQRGKRVIPINLVY